MIDLLATINEEKLILIVMTFATLWMAGRAYPSFSDWTYDNPLALVLILGLVILIADPTIIDSWPLTLGWLLIIILITNLFQITTSLAFSLFSQRLRTQWTVKTKIVLQENNQFTREHIQTMLEEAKAEKSQPTVWLWPAKLAMHLAVVEMLENMLRTYDKHKEFRKPYKRKGN